MYTLNKDVNFWVSTFGRWDEVRQVVRANTPSDWKEACAAQAA